MTLAAEFRHRSWNCDETAESLRQRNIALVWPDVPDIDALYSAAGPIVTSDIAYVRLHSRDAGKWYAGATKRYDYDYTDEDIRQLIRDWSDVDIRGDTIYVYFNNCHAGKAAKNALKAKAVLASR